MKHEQKMCVGLSLLQLGQILHLIHFHCFFAARPDHLKDEHRWTLAPTMPLPPLLRKTKMKSVNEEMPLPWATWGLCCCRGLALSRGFPQPVTETLHSLERSDSWYVAISKQRVPASCIIYCICPVQEINKPVAGALCSFVLCACFLKWWSMTDLLTPRPAKTKPWHIEVS